MLVIRLLLLFLLFLLVRRLFRAVKAVGAGNRARRAERSRGDATTGPEDKYGDLTEQGIDDADFEEIP